jgi:plastocyanin
MRATTRRLVTLLAAAALAACDGGGGTDPEPQPTTGRVRGTVSNGGAGVEGVTVRLDGGAPVQTAANGQYTFDDVSAGSHTVTLTLPANFALEGNAAQAVSVAGGQTATANYALTPLANGTAVVHLTDNFRFFPSEVTLPRGARIRWVNDVAMAHTITPGNAGQAGAWASQGISAAGATFEHTFATAGNFPYHCIPHQGGGMTGTIRVQ